MDEIRRSKNELSCLIGNLFDTIEPPCVAEHIGEIVITGTTRSGKKALLAITEDAFFFDGDPEDLIMVTTKTCPHKGECRLFHSGAGGSHG